MKNIPTFKNEDEERDFWASQDSSEYIDWSEAGCLALPNLKPSTKSISIRLPESMIESLKILANQMDVPYQSLIKMFLSDCIRREMKNRAA